MELTSGHPLAPGTQIECATKQDHEILSFSTEVLEETSTPISGLLLTRPKSVERRPLRRTPRASTQMPATYRCYQETGGKPHPTVEAMIVDLSRDGALLAAPSVPESDRLCLALSLPTGCSTDVECVARNTRRTQKGRGPVFVGVEFALIEPGTKLEIDFFLAASELRRRAKQ